MATCNRLWRRLCLHHVVCGSLCIIAIFTGRLTHAEWDVNIDRGLLENHESLLLSIQGINTDNRAWLNLIEQHTSNTAANTAYLANLLDGSASGGIGDQLTTIISHVDDLESLVALIQGQTDQLEQINTDISFYTQWTRNQIINFRTQDVPSLQYALDSIDNNTDEINQSLDEVVDLLIDIEYETNNDPGAPPAAAVPAGAAVAVPAFDPIASTNNDYSWDLGEVEEPAEEELEAIADLDWSVSETTPNLDITLQTSLLSPYAGFTMNDLNIPVDEQWIKTNVTPFTTPLLIGFATIAGALMIWEETRKTA